MYSDGYCEQGGLIIHPNGLTYKIKEKKLHIPYIDQYYSIVRAGVDNSSALLNGLDIVGGAVLARCSNASFAYIEDAEPCRWTAYGFVSSNTLSLYK